MNDRSELRLPGTFRQASNYLATTRTFWLVKRGGEDRHVLTGTPTLYVCNTSGHLVRIVPGYRYMRGRCLANLASSLPRWLAQRIKERIRLGGRAQPGRRVAQPHAHVGLTEHIGDDR